MVINLMRRPSRQQNPRPPQTAEELDIMRKKEFMSNLGKTGIMYEVAYRVAKGQLGQAHQKMWWTTGQET